MQFLLFALVAVFCVGTILPELLRKSENPKLAMISNYFNGTYHLYQVAGFSALIAAFILLAIFKLSGFGSLMAFIVAGCLTVVMTSDTWAKLYGKDHQKFHLTAAKIIFFLSLIFEFWVAITRYNIPLLVLAIAYPVITGAYALLQPSQKSWQEKLAVTCITAYWLTFIYII